MSAQGKWRRVRKCPVCGKTGYCTATEDAVKCMRVQSAKPVNQKDGAVGWIHPMPDSPAGKAAASLPTGTYNKPLTHAEVAIRVKQNRTAVEKGRLLQFSKSMGLSVRSLVAYGIGWDDGFKAWSFPMYDGSADSKGAYKACGLRLRRPDGRKFAVPGSRNGVFIPDGIFDVEQLPDFIDPANNSPLMILTPEGPTDSAAAMDMGFRAIGRPSNSGGIHELVRVLLSRKPQEIVVVADRDATKFLQDGTPYWPGIEGALSLCKELVSFARPLRFLMPPEGLKDLREWLPKSNPIDLITRCQNAPIVTRDWLIRADAKVKRNRNEQRRVA